jgi:hypothetical protein
LLGAAKSERVLIRIKGSFQTISLSFAFQNCFDSKMEDQGHLEKSMKNSSAPRSARAHEDEGTGFSTVTRSKAPKANRNPSTQKEVDPFSFKDPFGVTIPTARTKQTARIGTRGSSYAFCKGAQQDAMKASAAPAHRVVRSLKPKATLPRNAYVDPEPSDGSDSGWETANEVSPPPPNDGPTAPKTNSVVDVPCRFNGRIHKTPADGSCGAHALWEALRHLASSKGYKSQVFPGAGFRIRCELDPGLRS